MVEIEALPAQTVAFALCSGGYTKLPKRLNQLFGWLRRRGLPMAGAPFGRLPGSAEDAAAGKFSWELLVPVAASTATAALDSEQIGIKRIEGREAATELCRGPYDTPNPAFAELTEWIRVHGYIVAGCREEWWLDDDDDVPAAELRTKVAVPVARQER